MKITGYILEVIGVWMFFSAYREATYRGYLDVHGTDKGKKYSARLRVFAVSIRVVIGILLLAFGWWMYRGVN